MKISPPRPTSDPSPDTRRHPGHERTEAIFPIAALSAKQPKNTAGFLFFQAFFSGPFSGLFNRQATSHDKTLHHIEIAGAQVDEFASQGAFVGEDAHDFGLGVHDDLVAVDVAERAKNHFVPALETSARAAHLESAQADVHQPALHVPDGGDVVLQGTTNVPSVVRAGVSDNLHRSLPLLWLRFAFNINQSTTKE